MEREKEREPYANLRKFLKLLLTDLYICYCSIHFTAKKDRIVAADHVKKARELESISIIARWVFLPRSVDRCH
jgi:hypothetical protein